MSPMAAWPIAVLTSFVLLGGVVLAFDGSRAWTAIYIGTLVLPVGFIPTLARSKRMNSAKWTVGAVFFAVIQMLSGFIFVHPLVVLLALFFIRPEPSLTRPVTGGFARGNNDGELPDEGAGVPPSSRDDSASEPIQNAARSGPVRRRSPSRRRTRR